jgi:hypothetical protein
VTLVRRVIVLLALLPILAVAVPAAAHVREPSPRVVGRDAPQPASAMALPDTVAPAPPAELHGTAPEAHVRPIPLAVAVMAALLLLVAAGAALGGIRVRRAAAAATGALVLVFIAESGPHLVHHALDPAQAEQCQILKASSHSDGTTVAADSLPVPGTLEWLHLVLQLRPPAGEGPAACGRAPPAA